MPAYNSTHQIQNILIIDDDATIRLLMKDALSEEEYIIDEVDNGFDALERISTKLPDLVLLDVNMPGMDGYEVCSKIRKYFDESEISIVMVTGLDDSDSIEKAYSLGATAFINKPINWNTFHYRIQYLLKANAAIKKVKQRELYLENMENISSIITQDKNKEIILQDTMTAMLDIFSADRAFIIKPVNTKNDTLIIEFETLAENIDSLDMIPDTIIDNLEIQLANPANHPSHPIITYYGDDHVAPEYDTNLAGEMFKMMKMQNKQDWYLVIQQCGNRPPWTSSDQTTFNEISIRLNGVISQYLLSEELHHNQRLLLQAQRIGRLGNWHWDATTNELLWSDEIYRIYGFHNKSFTPNIDQFYKVVFEEDTHRLSLLERISDKTNDSYQIEHRIRTMNDEVIWVSEQCTGVFDEAGSLLEINGVVQDINDAHIKKEQEVHNYKMEAVGQLTSGIAHDFGNFMTVAGGNLRLLDETIISLNITDEEVSELIEDAQSAVQDSIELTKQLLNFSRKQPIAPAYVEVATTFTKFKKLFENTVGKNIELEIDTQKSLPSIFVDPTQFESALLNIIINARNAMPDGGKLSINAEIMNTRQSPEIIHNANNKLGERFISIYVKDNGVGMTEDVIKHSIEPFFTTQKNNQGTGLGLSMVYGFIKQSSGELVIHSQPGKGTTIYMQFPIHSDQTHLQSKDETIISLAGKKATILIVEDQYRVRQFAVRCLKQPGINILEAQDAAEAKELLSSNTIDLLFTDILMPGDMNGHELAEWTSNNHPDVKILLTTATEGKLNKGKSIRDHKLELMPKPYSKEELTKYISKYI